MADFVSKIKDLDTRPVQLRYRNQRYVRDDCVRASDGHERGLRKEQHQALPEVEVPSEEVEGSQPQKPQQQNY